MMYTIQEGSNGMGREGKVNGGWEVGVCGSIYLGGGYGKPRNACELCEFINREWIDSFID